MAICTLALLSRSPPAEMLAIAIGCRAQSARKRAMQRFRVLHADATRHGPDGEISCLEQPPRRLDTKRLDEDRRRRAGLTPEGAGECARAHAAPPRQRVNGEVLVEVIAEPRLELGDRRRGGALGAELGAELRLTAGALHENDEPPRGLVRERRAVVCLHQREEEIDAGGHARRGPPVAVVDVDAVREDAHGWMAGGEGVTRSPVRGRLVAVEPTGLGEEP